MNAQQILNALAASMSAQTTKQHLVKTTSGDDIMLFDAHGHASPIGSIMPETIKDYYMSHAGQVCGDVHEVIQVLMDNEEEYITHWAETVLINNLELWVDIQEMYMALPYWNILKFIKCLVAVAETRPECDITEMFQHVK